MNIKKGMLTLLILMGYLSFMLGLNVAIVRETERLKKETEILVNQIVDRMEEIYLQQQNNK